MCIVPDLEMVRGIIYKGPEYRKGY
jgi:hypothetical protein